jgi:hypothetical protein
VILVSIADAAYFTHIPASTIRRWVAHGQITGYGGKPWKVDMLEVEKQRHAHLNPCFPEASEQSC